MSTTSDLNVWYNDFIKKAIPTDALAKGFTSAQMAAYRKDPDDWYLLKLNERIDLLAAGKGGVTLAASTTQIKNFQPIYRGILERRAAALKTQIDAWNESKTIQGSIQSQIDALKQEKAAMEASRQESLSAIRAVKDKVTSKPAMNMSKIQQFARQVSSSAVARGGPTVASGASTAAPAARAATPSSAPAKGGSMRRGIKSKRHTRRLHTLLR
jgi:hypothetical protein